MDNLGVHAGERAKIARLAPDFDLWLRDKRAHWSDTRLASRWGDFPRWRALLRALPPPSQPRFTLSPKIRISDIQRFSAAEKELLLGLHPWRKGPFEICGLNIDSEWRSDMKWNRLAGHLGALSGRRILDVGGGNGYFSFRLCAGEPDLVVCLEPMGLYWAQYISVRRYTEGLALVFVPMTLEEFAPPIRFDVVLSLGVLYHSQRPDDHLRALRRLICPGGRLILETLVMPEEFGALELPAGQRYAQMRNVWLIPTVPDTLSWLGAAGFCCPRVLSQNPTTPREQRSTEWMRFHSLSDFLAPDRPDRTVEGWPAPVRALFSACTPAG